MLFLPSDKGVRDTCAKVAPDFAWRVASARGPLRDFFVEGSPDPDASVTAADAAAVRDAVTAAVCTRFPAVDPDQRRQKGRLTIKVRYTLDGEQRAATFHDGRPDDGPYEDW